MCNFVKKNWVYLAGYGFILAIGAFWIYCWMSEGVNPCLENQQDWADLSETLSPAYYSCPSEDFVLEAQEWAKAHPETEAAQALRAGIPGGVEWCYVSAYRRNDTSPTVLQATQIILEGPSGPGLSQPKQDEVLWAFNARR